MGPKKRGVRNLPYQKYLRRREAKLCYHYGGPFVLGHKCPDMNLRLIILAEDECINAEGEIIKFEAIQDFEDDAIQDEEVEYQWMDLSMCSVGGLTQPSTMKLEGRIHDRKVMILIDSVASHNFISTMLVEQMSLPMRPTRSYGVILGDGNKEKHRGAVCICR